MKTHAFNTVVTIAEGLCHVGDCWQTMIVFWHPAEQRYFSIIDGGARLVFNVKYPAMNSVDLERLEITCETDPVVARPGLPSFRTVFFRGRDRARGY